MSMNAASNLVSIIPPAPRVPRDFAALLTFSSKQTKAQKERVNASIAREHGCPTDGATCPDELG